MFFMRDFQVFFIIDLQMVFTKDFKMFFMMRLVIFGLVLGFDYSVSYWQLFMDLNGFFRFEVQKNQNFTEKI